MYGEGGGRGSREHCLWALVYKWKKVSDVGLPNFVLTFDFSSNTR